MKTHIDIVQWGNTHTQGTKQIQILADIHKIIHITPRNISMHLEMRFETSTSTLLSAVEKTTEIHIFR